MSGDQAGLAAHLAWLYPDKSKPCKCEHGYTGMGRIQGIDMGKQWVRTTTHPDCYHHGTVAQATFKRTGRWPR